MLGKLRDSWCVWRRKIDTAISSINSSISTINRALTDAGGMITDLWGAVTQINNEMQYLTEAPTEANTSGKMKFVVLTEEPQTYYDGYYYIIVEGSSNE